MKKKIIVVVLGACIAVLFAGCTEKLLSNDYITITQYQGLPVAGVEDTEVTASMVDSEIEYNLSASSGFEEVTDRAAKEGDLVQIDYIGTVEGKEFGGGSSEGVTLELGMDQLFKAQGEYESFADQVAGHKTGDEFEVTVQLTEDYRDENVAGKTARFHVVLKSIMSSVIPELSDEWVRSNCEAANTVLEYREVIKKQLKEQRMKNKNTVMRSRVMEALLDHVEVKQYPEDQVADKSNELVAYYQGMADSLGIQFDEYSQQYLGMTEEEFHAEVERTARKSIITSMACELIADQKGIDFADDQNELEQYVKDNGYESVDVLLKQVSVEEIKGLILQDKVADYLIERCVQNE